MDLELGSYRTIEVQPLSPALGAVVHGLDIRAGLDDQQVADVHDALLRHLVLFFRDQDVDDESQAAFTARFGDLEVIQGSPVSMIEDAADEPPGVDEWHTDVSNKPQPPAIAVLSSCIVPPAGGDTCWVSLYAAYDALSSTMQRFAQTLQVRHWASPRFLEMVVRNHGEELAAKLRSEMWAVQPLVRTHPVTGRQALYLSVRFAERILDVTPGESDALLRYFNSLLEDLNLQLRWHWREGDVAMWDNRCTNHRALSNHYPAHRLMRRTTVLGDAPFYRPSEPILTTAS